MKLFLFVLFTAYLLISSQFYFSSTDQPFQPILPQADSIVTISISAVGDIMCHAPQFEYARVRADSFDFNPSFEFVADIISESDFAFGNLETVTAGKDLGYSGYPMFNSPSELLDALKNAGFDLLTTANNHSLDRGEIGILRTIEELNKREIKYNGTFVNQSDRDSIRLVIIKGISIALLAYSYGTNGNPIPKGKSYLINLINFDLIKEDIQKAKSQNPDLILVHYHFGEEYQRHPNQIQKEIVDTTIKMGADIIIGGHPHVLQPLEFVKSNLSNLDSVFIAYSLGNFFSNQRKRYTDAGGILTLTIEKNLRTNKVKINSVEFVPTWVYKGVVENKRAFVIIPSMSINEHNLKYLTKIDFQKLTQSINDTKSILKKSFVDVKFR